MDSSSREAIWQQLGRDAALAFLTTSLCDLEQICDVSGAPTGSGSSTKGGGLLRASPTLPRPVFSLPSGKEVLPP